MRRQRKFAQGESAPLDRNGGYPQGSAPAVRELKGKRTRSADLNLTESMPARIALHLLGPDGTCYQPGEQKYDYEPGKASHESIIANPSRSQQNRECIVSVFSTFPQPRKLPNRNSATTKIPGLTQSGS